MTTNKQKNQKITDSRTFKFIDEKGRCVIDDRPPYEKLNIPDGGKLDKKIMFWNPFTELHPED